MMDAATSTWVVVPLFNEEEVIAEVIRGIREVFPLVVCVDDGSWDASARVSEEAGAIVLRHGVNLGQGAALKTGIDYALTDPSMRQIVTFDADGQHRIEDAAAMVEHLREKDLDVVLGSRFLDARTRPGLLKRLVLRLAVTFTNLTTGMHLTDTHNGLRVLSRHAAETMRLEQNRMAHASEIISEIAKHHLRVEEHPVRIEYTSYSRKKGQPLLNAVNIIAEMLLR